MAKALAPVSAIVQKWQQNTAGATQSYVDGIKRVQTAPGQLAAQKKNKYVQGVINSADKWATNVASISLQTWQNLAATKGAANLATGVNAAVPKTTAFWNKFGPVLQNAMAQVNQMPTDTYQQRQAKSTAMQDLLHQFSNAM